MIELRPCPKCGAAIDINYVMNHLGWRTTCITCHTNLIVDCEELGDEMCVWFEVDPIP